jgi:two-component system sensor histidine kinase/response regulator
MLFRKGPERVFVLLLLLGGAWLQAKTLVLLGSDSEAELRDAAKEISRSFGKQPRLERRDGMPLLILGPLPDGEESAALYYRIKKRYPSATVTVLPERGNASVASRGSAESYRLWIALFALAVTGILALFVSSRKMQRLTERHERIRERHEAMEQRFNELFHRLGENIYRLSKDIVRYTDKIAKDVEDREMGEKLRRVVRSENRIVDTTSNLLDFLRLKAKKVVIRKDRFDINSVLDDVVESLAREKGRIGGIDTELVFDIDREIPKYVVGDFVHIGEVLSNLLEIALERSEGTEVILAVKIYKPFAGPMELQFRITYYPGDEDEKLEEYFVPHYDERSGEYRRLGGFVAYELTRLMGGTATVARNPRLNQTVLDLTIPVESAQGEERRKYRLDRKEYIRKNVLIVNRNYDASLALKEMFSYFRHRVRIMDAEQFESRRPRFEEYDILAIDEELVDLLLVDHVRKARSRRELKVVGLRNLFSPARLGVDPDFFDARETKPLNYKRVLGLINRLYGLDKTEEKEGEKVRKERELLRPEFWSEIPETPRVNLESFRDFSGAHILVVEDNEINLKMLLKVLGVSGMHLLTARNGEEALNRVRSPEGEALQLILMDINMPVMDGLTATRRIRQLPNGGEVPIIALSALNLQNEIDRMKRAGMDGYLPKPLNIGRLYSLFERYIGSSSVHRIDLPPAKPSRPEGIAFEEALRRTRGDEMLLREILQEFLEAYGESDQKLRELYEEGDLLTLRQLTLDILGLSGTIGATELHRLMKEMYKLQLYNKMDLLPNYFIEYEVALKRVRESLRRYLGTDGRG